MRPLVIALSAVLLLAVVAALSIGLARRSQTAGAPGDGAFPTTWRAGQFTYRTDISTTGCKIRITTEVLEPQGFEAENRMLIAPLSTLDPTRIETTTRNPALGLPGMITFHARPGENLRCELLSGRPCPTPTRDRAELQLPPYWADRPDDFARLIRADMDGCSTND